MSNKKSPYQAWGIIIMTLSVFAGCALTALLPIGMILGLNTKPWELVFEAHLILLLAALLTTTLFMFRLTLKSKAEGGIFLLVTAIFVAGVALLGALPITARDALIHHLAVPKWWLQAGTINQINWHDWSYYPMLLDLGLCGLLKWNLEYFTPYYHGAYLVLTAGLVAWYVARRTDQSTFAWIGFLITLTIPVCLKLASIPLVDFGLCLYCAIAAFGAILACENPDKAFGYLVLTGLSLGLALSTKPNGMLFVALFAPGALVLASRSKVSGSFYLGGLIICAAFILSTFGFWLVKNSLWTSNPLYPFLQNIFGGQEQLIAEVPTALPGPLKQRMLLYNEEWLDLALLPIRMIFTGQDDKPQFFDGVLSPLLILALVPIFRLRRPAGERFLSFMMISYFLFALVTGPARVRYLAPILAPTAILTTLGLLRLSDLFHSHIRTFFYWAVLGLHLTYSGSYLFELISNSGAIPFIREHQNRDEYLRNHVADYAMIEYINQQIDPKATIYLLYTGNRFYYYNRNVISGGYESERYLLNWIRNSSDAHGLANQLKQSGISYILEHRARAEKSLPDLLSPTEKVVWSEFSEKNLTLIHEISGLALYEIRLEEMAP
jgi:hypothetical protein